jgi:hypothetical protein
MAIASISGRSAHRRSSAHASAWPLPRAAGSWRSHTVAPAAAATAAVASVQLSATTMVSRRSAGWSWAASAATAAAIWPSSS